MASHLEVSREWYGKLENGQGDISIKQLEKIAEILEARIEEIWPSNNVRNFTNTNNGKWKYYESGVHEIELKDLYERLLEEKDKEISFLKDLLNKK